MWRYQLTQEDSRIRRIARLAGLILDDCEIAQFETDLSDMVSFVQRVGRIQLDDDQDSRTEPSPLRADEPHADPAGDSLFGPDRLDEQGFLIVPPVLGEDT